MTRDNLIQAIYDNADSWSCASPCPHTMEEENPKDVCWGCAEKQLAEYEAKIGADVISNSIAIMKNRIIRRDTRALDENENGVNFGLLIAIEILEEQLKEQKHE